MPRLSFPILILMFPAALLAAELEPSVTLKKPIDGAVMFSRKVDVKGIASGANRVMLLVQPIDSNDPWRVAGIVRPEPDGYFDAAVRFPLMHVDSAYRVIAVAGVRKASLRSTQPGTTMRRPPSGLPHSQVVRIAIAGAPRAAFKSDGGSDRILLPVDHATVGPVETVVIEGSGEPPPLVLIRNAETGSHWYVQPPVQRIGLGRTAVAVRFGSDRTADGSQFRLRLAFPRSDEQREKLKAVASFAELPAEITYGRSLVVSFDPRKKPTADLAQLKQELAMNAHQHETPFTAPPDGSSVSRRPIVRGHCPLNHVPVLVVRSEQDASTWYVQPPCQRRAGAFENRIYLGKPGTPAGTRFHVVTMLVAPEEAGKYRAGDTLMEFPDHTPISRPLLLVHNGRDE